MDLSAMAEKALRMVREAREVSYDTEGTGLDWRYNNPIGYVIGAANNGVITQDDVVYIPVRHGGGGNLPGCPPVTSATDKIQIHPFEIELAKAFNHRNSSTGMGRVVGHNMKFDVHMSANTGVMLGRNLACTQNMAAMLDEYQHTYSLDACASKYKIEQKRGQVLYDHLATLFGGRPDKKIMSEFWRTAGNDPIVQEYSVGDGVTTMQLWWEQVKKIREEGMELVAELENDLIWCIFRTERKGIAVDVEKAADLERVAEERTTLLLKKFPVGFNTRSPKWMVEAFTQAGLTDWPKTELGNPSFTEKWLKKSELGRAIIEIRQATNLINSFVKPLTTEHVWRGRVHANLNQLRNDERGTISGRFSCDSPNLQQVPKRNKELAKPFRTLFVADEGWDFWERDYSQCEPRLFAHYSQDPNLLRGYNAEPFVDVHQVVAELLQVERDPTAKRMNMGIFTGMQTKTFSEHMGWPLDKATAAWNLWYEKFPSIRQFQYKAKTRLGSRGYVHTLLGRRCRLEHPRFAYVGASKIIQGGNADIIKWKYREVDRMCEDAGDIVQILMTVHDSFNGQKQRTPEADALFEEINRTLERVKCPPFDLSVPFVVEGHIGKNWSEATYGVAK